LLVSGSDTIVSSKTAFFSISFIAFKDFTLIFPRQYDVLYHHLVLSQRVLSNLCQQFRNLHE